MKVILKEDVEKLGRIGEIVNVADGYARNYLVPKKLAVEANTKNVKEFEHHKNNIMKKAEKIKKELEKTSDKLSAVTITLKAKAGEEDKLFGSITSMQIAEALKAEGYDIDKKKINIEDPIKRLGTYTVDIKIHPELSTKITVEVIPESSD